MRPYIALLMIFLSGCASLSEWGEAFSSTGRQFADQARQRNPYVRPF